MGGLKKRRAEVFAQIETYLAREKRLPTPQQVRQEHGVPIRTAYRYLDAFAQERGMERSRAMPRIDKKTQDRAVQAVRDGASVSEACAALSISESTLRRALDDAEVQPRRAPRGEKSLRRDPRTEIRLVSRCARLLQAAVRREDALPHEHRRAVAALCQQVLCPRLRERPSPAASVVAAVEHYALRRGVAVTEEDLCSMLPWLESEVLMRALSMGVRTKTLRRTRAGYLPAGEGHLTRAREVQALPETGWGEDLLAARTFVLDVLLKP